MSVGLEEAVEFEDAMSAAFATLDEERRDPLRFFRFSSWAQRMVAEHIGREIVYWRAGNSSGKTLGIAFIAVALLRGEQFLDGVALLPMELPGVWWVLTKSYRQQVDASQAAYLKAIGDWPHEISWAFRSKNYIDSIWLATKFCRHATGSHCSTCSRIVFHCEQSGVESALGGRISGAHCDEPPPEKIWRELVSRKRAGERLFVAIGATPLYRQDWEWLAKEFNFGTGLERDGKIEFRSGMLDNMALTQEDKDFFLRQWKTDYLLDARLSGDYIDDSGACPFYHQGLNRWASRCRPASLVGMTVRAERFDDHGQHLEKRRVELQVWQPRVPGHSYWGIIDPSTGVDPESGARLEHDPACLFIVDRHTAREVACYDGYLGGHGMSVLATKVGRYYNRGSIDVEMNGGYGLSVVDGLMRLRYSDIAREEVPRRQGKMGKRVGWHTTEVSRGHMVAAIQRSLEEDSFRTEDAHLVSTLRSVIVDKSGKVLAQHGRHDEKMICLGRALINLALRPVAPLLAEEPRRPRIADALEKDIGRPVIADDGDDQPRRRLIRRRR